MPPCLYPALYVIVLLHHPLARVPPCLCSTMMNIVCTQCHMYRELYLQRASHLAFWFDHSSPQCVVMGFFFVWVTFFGLVVV